MRLIFLSIVLFICGELHAQHFNSPLASEAARFEATIDQDVAVLKMLIHDDLLYIHSNGFEEKGLAYIESVTTGKIKYQSFKRLVIPNVVLLSRNVALIDGKVKVEGLYEGQPFEVILRYTSAYRKEKKSWKLIRWQSLKVKE